jgi:hypothetical protein
VSSQTADFQLKFSMLMENPKTILQEGRNVPSEATRRVENHENHAPWLDRMRHNAFCAREQ